MTTGQLLSPRALSGDPANDGYVLTTVGSVPMWMPPGVADLDDLTDVDVPTPADGQVLTWDSATSQWIAETPPGGGGGGTGFDRRWNVGSGETSIDEFNDGAINGAWTRVDGTGAAAGNLAWAEGADVLSAKSVGGDSAASAHGFVRALASIGGSLAVGDGFITAITVAGSTTNFSMSGLAFTDGITHGAGNQMWASADFATPNFVLRRMSAWTSMPANGGSATAWPHRGLIYLRLALVATDSWRMDWSDSGVHWAPAGAAVTLAFTPTHVGFMDSSWGGNHTRMTSYQFLRRVSGIT